MISSSKTTMLNDVSTKGVDEKLVLRKHLISGERGKDQHMLYMPNAVLQMLFRPPNIV
jgi:hypothetical protein